MSEEYDDIINLPRPLFTKRKKMSARDRAAQFSPFAALSGHDSAIKETARLTDMKSELDEHMKYALNDRLKIISERLIERHEIIITYFKPDAQKKGGAYLTARGAVKKIDEYERVLLIGGGEKIPIDEIIGIEGDVFDF